jgi:hypothetical protein
VEGQPPDFAKAGEEAPAGTRRMPTVDSATREPSCQGMENKQKHLEFIQSAVARMASNLFLLKGWTITLIAALFALAAKGVDDVYFLIAYFPAFMFWVLDGYFLAQERQFRALYDHVRSLDEASIDFSMDTSPFKDQPRNTWSGAMLSRTLLLYYGVLICTMIIVMSLITR